MSIDSPTCPESRHASSSSGAAAIAGLAGMHPAYFGMVMATGIVSIASQLLASDWGAALELVARLLFGINIAAYLVLWVLTISRFVRHRDRFTADLMHHGRSVGFFTTVAGTCVLGSQMLIVGDSWGLACALWIMGIVLWAVTTYGVFTVLTVKASKPTLAEGINGGWLLGVVAAQSVAVLGAQLSAGFSSQTQPMILFGCTALWLGGGMLYVWIISLIFYRYTFFPMNPSDLAPPYWINMGAVAISTLAGTMLIANASHASLLLELMPFVKGLTIAFWATATWWIPMLVILGVWRHLYCRFPLRYDPLYWGAVFPLGMYTTCTLRLSQSLDWQPLAVIPRYFVLVAIAAWVLTSIGYVLHRVQRRSVLT